MALLMTWWLKLNQHLSETDTAKLENLYYIMVRERKICNRAAQEQLNKQQWANAKCSVLFEWIDFVPNQVFLSCD